MEVVSDVKEGIGYVEANTSEKVWSVISFEPKNKNIIETDSLLLDDGYKWRKDGKKKEDIFSSKFPRKYYRCAYKGCKVKKQIQRLTMDEAVTVTYYHGGLHSHSAHLSSINLPKQWTNLN